MRWLLPITLLLAACTDPVVPDASPPEHDTIVVAPLRHDGGMKFGEQIPRFRVMNNGTFLPAYLRMNFTGGGCVDNAGAGQIDCTLAAGSLGNFTFSGSTENLSAPGTLTFGANVTGISESSGTTLTVGANVLIGSVADKLNAAKLAIASQAVGDILSADTTTTFSRVAAVATGSYLRSAGTSTLPVWSTLTLPNAATQGDLIVATGTNAIGSVADVATGQVLASGGANTVPAYTANPSVTSITTTSGSDTITVTGSNTINFVAASGTARLGMRNATARQTVRTSTAPPDCGGATLNLTVANVLDSGIATCATAQTVNFPTWQGAAGIVQNMPGTPAVGDVIFMHIVASGANALTIGAGTGGTIGGSTTVPANSDKTYWCRITAITSNTETATCY